MGHMLRVHKGIKVLEKRISAEIFEQIRNGKLRSGDRLPGIRELCIRHRVSQKVVERVIRNLQDILVIETRPQSGSYVTAKALEIVAAGKLSEPARSAEHLRRPSIDSYLIPRGIGKNCITAYITEIIPENINFWRRSLDEFCRNNHLPPGKLLTCLDGHIEEVLENEHVDVILTSPLIIESLGAEKFINMSGIIDSQIHSGLVDPIRKFICHKDSLSCIVPFSMTAFHLFTNIKLEKYISSAYPVSSVIDLIGLAKKSRGKIPAGSTAIYMASLMDLPLDSGAVTIRADGLLHLDKKLLENALSELSGAKFPIIDSNEIVNEFSAGRLLFMRHCSFSLIEIRQKASFPWRVVPFPAAMPIPVDFIGLAIPENSRHRHAAIDFVNSMLSDGLQESYGRLGGNVPVCKCALKDNRPPEMPLGIDYKAAIANTSAFSRHKWMLMTKMYPYFKTLLAVNAGTLSISSATASIAELTERTNSENVKFS